tara:strand:+ start:368 stop:1228 length:861 start_codon:yes stop_codon:yes gene_type:complete
MRYYNGNFIRATDQNVDQGNAKGFFNLEAQLIYKSGDNWPITASTDPTNGYIEFSRRFIASDSYMGGGSGDYDGGYDVTDINIPSSYSGSARVYIGQKIGLPTGGTYLADMPIACIQILNSAGNSLLKSWNWSGGSDQGWENLATKAWISGTSTIGFPETLATSAARTYGGSLVSGADKNAFTYASSTGSSYTGCADGISSNYSENGVDSGIGTILPSPGNAVVSQASNTNYLYRETSDADRYSGVVCRSPAYSFSGGEIIRIAHALTGYSNNPLDANDCLYIGVT